MTSMTGAIVAEPGRPTNFRVECVGGGNAVEGNDEDHNLIEDTKYAGKIAALKARLQRLMRETAALPDKMPIDGGIKTELPAKGIR
jgi:hypothetical protein